jgi:hypothetical protein
MDGLIRSIEWRTFDHGTGALKVTLHDGALDDAQYEKLVRRFAAVIPGAVKCEDMRQAAESETFRMYYPEMPKDRKEPLAVGQAMCNLPDNPVVVLVDHPTLPRVVMVGLAYPASFLDLQRLLSLSAVQTVHVSDASVYNGAVVELFVPNTGNISLRTEIAKVLAF